MKTCITGWPTVSGTRVSLAINPVEGDIYDTYSIGAGTSADIWHNRHLSVANVPVDAVPFALDEWLQGKAEIIDEIIAGYLGSEWNGNNYVGSWTERAQELADALSDEISMAYSQFDLPTYWDAGDYYWNAMSVSDVLDEIGDRTLDDYIKSEIESAKSNGAYLDPANVRETFMEAFEPVLAAYDEEYGESNELTGSQAATARRLLAA